MAKLPTDERQAEYRLALSYAPGSHRAALTALFALDGTLGGLVRAARTPMVAQLRLAWWREALSALDRRPVPAQPVLRSLAAEVVPDGVDGAWLARIVDGWEALIDEPLERAALALHAEARGVMLFRAAATLLGCTDGAVDDAGAGWALADLAVNLSQPAVAASAAAMGSPRIDLAMARRWSRAGRPLGAMALLARADLAGTLPASPRRVGRLLIHRLTGF